MDLDNPFLFGRLVSPAIYVELDRRRQHIWERICVTDVSKGTLSPQFRPILLALQSLCNMQLDRKIRFRVMCESRIGEYPLLLGELITTTRILMASIGRPLPLYKSDDLLKLQRASNVCYHRGKFYVSPSHTLVLSV